MNVNRRNPASLSRPGIPLISPEFGSVEDEVMEIKEQAELALEDAELAMDRVERAIVKKVDVATSVQNHRKFLYMLGAPVLIYAGLTNKNRPTVGKIAALIGAFVGLRNYRAFGCDGRRLGRFGKNIGHSSCFTIRLYPPSPYTERTTVSSRA
jgi:hypothetical protein